MDKLRAGIIGCGRIVEEGHARAFQENSDRVEVVALADPSPERLRVIGKLLDVPEKNRFADYKEMLARTELDLVDLALPHFLHEEVTVYCAHQRVDILSEKPLSTSLESVDRILQAVEEKGMRLGVYHNYKWIPAFAKARELIEGGKIGQPFLIRFEHLGGGHYPGAQAYDPNWRTKASRAGGGCLLDNGYHFCYLAEWLMGAPVESVYGRVGTFVQQQDVDDLALLLLNHANGAVSSVQFSWAVKSGGERASEVCGTEGTLRFRWDEQPLALYENQFGEWTHPELDPNVHSFSALLSEFLTAFQTGGPLPVSGEEARHNLAIVMAGYESSRREMPVHISDPPQLSGQ
ncbi:MAG: Gfo/Idh/MocA family oxidoreductase [Chloroflexota bacterium]|nr:Gfo/Idh/MocA family oxidoreductase [Chloroflexota bacterium]